MKRAGEQTENITNCWTWNYSKIIKIGKLSVSYQSSQSAGIRRRRSSSRTYCNLSAEWCAIRDILFFNTCCFSALLAFQHFLLFSNVVPFGSFTCSQGSVTEVASALSRINHVLTMFLVKKLRMQETSAEELTRSTWVPYSEVPGLQGEWSESRHIVCTKYMLKSCHSVTEAAAAKHFLNLTDTHANPWSHRPSEKTCNWTWNWML